MSVTAARGFRAAGVTAGLKPSGRPDVALVVNDGPAYAAAAVYTSNRCRAHPVLWSEQVTGDGIARAVLLNSGGANCYTGPTGFQTTHASAERTAAGLPDCGAGDVVICSTGLIGEQLNRDLLFAGIDAALAELRPDGGPDAAVAIMTTDTRDKQVAITAEGGWTVGGMAKGAGMLAPGLATMLVVLTTDAEVDAATADAALRAATRVTFDRLDSDGCMSTNDTVLLMVSGASAVRPDPAEFAAAVRQACQDLAMQLLSDAEGAEHDIAIEVARRRQRGRRGRGGPRGGPQQPVQVRDLRQGPELGPDPGRRRHDLGRLRPARHRRRDERRLGLPRRGARRVPRSGRPDRPTGHRHRSTCTPAPAAATVWTNDLTHAYVHENSAYST